MRLAETGGFDAVITIGCLIKGDTMHFEYIASACSQGIVQASTATGVPISFGVLTTLTDEQAIARSAPGPENKGREAALAAIEMATLFQAVAREIVE
jgi:6,7-dimethyl-8-ribityllumazine synthase